MSHEHTEQTPSGRYRLTVDVHIDNGLLVPHDSARMLLADWWTQHGATFTPVADHPAPSEDTIARISDIIVSTYNGYIPVETTPVIESEAPNVAREIAAAGLLAHTEPYEPRPTAERAQAAYDRAAELYPPHVAGAVRWALGDGVMFDDAQAALIEEVLAARPVPSPGTTSEPTSAQGHAPKVSSDPSDEWCGVCDQHLNDHEPPGVGASSGQPQPGDTVRVTHGMHVVESTVDPDGHYIGHLVVSNGRATVEVVERAPEQPGGEQ